MHSRTCEYLRAKLEGMATIAWLTRRGMVHLVRFSVIRQYFRYLILDTYSIIDFVILLSNTRHALQY